MRSLYLWLFSLLIGATAEAQVPFSVHLEPTSIPTLGGLQSYAFAQHNGHWVLVGGRLDGLHRRQPWASFDIAGHNNQIWVVDANNAQVWTASIQNLPLSLQDQLSATNLQFYQKDDQLFLVGGYGYSQVISDHRTHPYLAVLDLPGLIQAVKNNGPLDPHIEQVNDAFFAVTGGYLLDMYNRFYIVGGQRFDGRYNPMGHGSFTQQYTEAVRRFEADYDGQSISYTLLPEWNDVNLFHRRDYNVLPQIKPNGEQGMIAFAGVFKPTVDLPFLNIVAIDSSGYAEVPGFQQFYHQYHCAHLPMYAAGDQEMHNLFFGGIAQFYDSAGVRVEDQNVPFVRTIASVSIDAQGNPTEWLLPVQMPDFLGASAEFIPLETLPTFANGVIKMDDLQSDTVLLGHIFGGIHSTAPNIFWINTGTQSTATSELFEVYLIRTPGQVGMEEENSAPSSSAHSAWFDEDRKLNLAFFLEQAVPVEVWMADGSGKEIYRKRIPPSEVQRGKNAWEANDLPADLPYWVIIGMEYNGRRVMWKALTR